MPPVLPPADGYLLIDSPKFHHALAADLGDEDAAFMADSQVPWGVAALEGAIAEPAWRVKPSWYLIASDDWMVPPPVQGSMAKRAGSNVSQASGSHTGVCLAT